MVLVGREHVDRELGALAERLQARRAPIQAEEHERRVERHRRERVGRDADAPAVGCPRRDHGHAGRELAERAPKGPAVEAVLGLLAPALVDQPPRLLGVEPPGEEDARVVEAVRDRARQRRQLLRRGEQLEDVRLRRREQRVRPLSHPLGVAAPVEPEHLLHPPGGERPVAAVEDRLEVRLRALGGVVRALARDRVVEDDRVGHAQHVRAARQHTDRPSHDGREAAGEDAVRVGQLDRAGALRLPGEVALEDLARPGQVLPWRADVLPAVHRPAWDPLEDHDLARPARRQRGEDEVLADPGRDVEADRRVLRPRLEPDAAHLGGAIGGFFFIRRSHLLRDFFDVFKDSRKEGAAHPRAPGRARPSRGGDREVDRILDKVHREGVHSLTPAERRVLAEDTERRRGGSR